MKKAFLVTLLSIGTIMSSGVAAFVYSSSTESEANIMVVIASYNNFISNEDTNINVNGEFKLIIGQEIETYCTINATCINKSNNDSTLENNYDGSYYFSWDSTYDSYFNFDNYKGNFVSGTIIDSPTITYKKDMSPITNEDINKLESTLKDKDIKITFKVNDDK